MSIINLKSRKLSSQAARKMLINFQDSEVFGIDLSQNDVTVLNFLQLFSEIRQLNLLRNNIGILRFLPQSLVRLDLSYNSLDSLAGIETCTNLLELNASFNAITSSAPVSVLTRLKDLRLANNRIRVLEGLDNLVNLVRLDMHDNQLNDLSVLRALTTNRALTAVDFRGNPVHKITGFRRLLLNALPQLANVDSIFTSDRVHLFSDIDLSTAPNVITPSGDVAASSKEEAPSPSESASTSASAPVTAAPTAAAATAQPVKVKKIHSDLAALDEEILKQQRELDALKKAEAAAVAAPAPVPVPVVAPVAAPVQAAPVVIPELPAVSAPAAPVVAAPQPSRVPPSSSPVLSLLDQINTAFSQEMLPVVEPAPVVVQPPSQAPTPAPAPALLTPSAGAPNAPTALSAGLSLSKRLSMLASKGAAASAAASAVPSNANTPAPTQPVPTAVVPPASLVDQLNAASAAPAPAAVSTASKPVETPRNAEAIASSSALASAMPANAIPNGMPVMVAVMGPPLTPGGPPQVQLVPVSPAMLQQQQQMYLNAQQLSPRGFAVPASLLQSTPSVQPAPAAAAQTVQPVYQHQQSSPRSPSPVPELASAPSNASLRAGSAERQRSVTPTNVSTGGASPGQQRKKSNVGGQRSANSINALAFQQQRSRRNLVSQTSPRGQNQSTTSLQSVPSTQSLQPLGRQQSNTSLSGNRTKPKQQIRKAASFAPNSTGSAQFSRNNARAVSPVEVQPPSTMSYFRDLGFSAGNLLPSSGPELSASALELFGHEISAVAYPMQVAPRVPQQASRQPHELLRQGQAAALLMQKLRVMLSGTLSAAFMRWKVATARDRVRVLAQTTQSLKQATAESGETPSSADSDSREGMEAQLTLVREGCVQLEQQLSASLQSLSVVRLHASMHSAQLSAPGRAVLTDTINNCEQLLGAHQAALSLYFHLHFPTAAAQQQRREDAELLNVLRSKNNELAAQCAQLHADNLALSTQLGRNALFVDNARRARASIAITHVVRSHHNSLKQMAFARWRSKFGPRRAQDALVEISAASRQQALAQLNSMRRSYQLTRAFAKWRNFSHQQARVELGRSRAVEFATVDQDREALLGLLVEAQTARDSLEHELRSLKDESANTLAGVLQRLQAIDAQAQRSGRLLVEQRQSHAAELARLDDALEGHRRRGALGRLKLVLASQRQRSLSSAWQLWRLTTLAHAMLLRVPMGVVTQDDEGYSASAPYENSLVGHSMSTPSLHTPHMSSSTAQTPMAGRSGGNMMSPLAMAAQSRAAANGLTSAAPSIVSHQATAPFNADELIPPQVLQAVNSPAPFSRPQKAAQGASFTGQR